MKSILIIEDETDLQDALNAAFITKGYDVRVAETSEEGLEMITESKPDLILLDIMTHSIHGLLFLQRLRDLQHKANDCKVIVITNMDNDEVKEKILTLNVSDYLIKAENSLDDIVAKVEEII